MPLKKQFTTSCLITVVTLSQLSAQTRTPNISMPKVMANPTQLAAPTPWLPIRWVLPKGTFLHAPRDGRPIRSDTRLGLRPGYRYRFQLDSKDIKNSTNLYPTLEILGSVRMPPSLRLFDYAAAIVITEEELKLANEGRLICKLLYLEKNDAKPAYSAGNMVPPQTDIPFGNNLLATANDMGRPVARLWLGSRELTSDEFINSVVPGTLWRDGDLPPGMPTLAPQFPCFISHPGYESQDNFNEVIHDGGDSLDRAIIDDSGRSQGVNPEDAVAEFTIIGSRRRILPSNKICIYSPRFAWLRQISGLGTVVLDAGVQGTVLNNGPGQTKVTMPSNTAVSELLLDGMRSRERASGARSTQIAGKSQRMEPVLPQITIHGPKANLIVKNPGAVSEVDGTARLRQREGLSVRLAGWRISQLQNEETVSAMAKVEQGSRLVMARAVTREAILDCKEEMRVLEQPLILHKWADRCEAGPGEIVTFTLRLTNQTGKPIAEVAIVDSLSCRLEFLGESANCNRDSVFLNQENEVNSTRLRWEITGLVQPGDTVVVSFKAKVR